MHIFEDRRIVLGVTGSIAAYKAATLASRLTQAGAKVDVVLTAAAQKLVSPLTFESVTGRKAYQEKDLWRDGEHVLHIELGEKNDVFIIAPATANTIAKLAHGIADNLLTVSALASRTPLLVAPAMDGGMYANLATQENLSTLEERGMTILGPGEGHLASGLAGKGRLLAPQELLGHIRLALAKDGPLREKKVLVTAGGTREPLDPVRVITNRSSGKQGYALAQAALDLGAEVMLISAPTALDPPVGSSLVQVSTTGQMKQAVLDALPGSDVLLMAAAVADYAPQASEKNKIKKEDQSALTLSLERTPDILREVAEYRSRHHHPLLTVGFAAETENLLDHAKNKMDSKNLDLLAANDVTDPEAGFDVDTNRVTLLWADGRVEELPVMGKKQVAARILDEVADILDQN